MVAVIGLAFFSGTLWQQVNNLKKGSSGTTTQPTTKPGIGNDKNQSGKLADFLKSAVDSKSLKSCLDSGKYDARLTSDQELATSLGSQGTPGFYVNSMFYAGAYSWSLDISDAQTGKVITNSSMKSIAEGAKTTPNSKISLATIKGLFQKDLIKFGDGNTSILFVEFSDPSCPYCQIAGGKNATLLKSFDKNGTFVPPVPEMKKVVEAGKASYVLIYSPGHGNGEMGMKALYCAYEQGKFWEANDLLMSNEGYVLMNGG